MGVPSGFKRTVHVNSLDKVTELFKLAPDVYLGITDKSSTKVVRRQLVKIWGMNCYKGERLQIAEKHPTGEYFNVFVACNKNKFTKT